MKKLSLKKVLFGLATSLVLALAIGSFALSETQTPANTQLETQNAAANAGTGAFNVSGGVDGTDYDYSTGVLSIHPQNSATQITISTNGETTDRIEITAGPQDAEKAVNIILNGVNIDRSGEAETDPKAALTIAENAAFNVNITLAGNSVNTLTGEAGDLEADPNVIGSPGIEKSDDGSVDVDQLGKLTIGGTGQLTANGGVYAAGIGGGNNKNTSKIAIDGGTITAIGSTGGAGIGGGAGDEGAAAADLGHGRYIWINGGDVTATAIVTDDKFDASGSGIGGGANGDGSYIYITGGKVKASVVYQGEEGIDALGGAAIGGGSTGDGSYIYISGGEVTATTNMQGGAGIGGGAEGDGSHIYISDGKVKATGGFMGAGIGGGGEGDGSDIYISGGDVESTGGGGAAGVGGGVYGNGDNIEATGGILKATGGLAVDEETGEKYSGAGIGGGASGDGSNNTINGDVIVIAESGDESKDPLEGFKDEDIKRGIIFTRKGNSGTYEGTVRGTVTLPGDFELPVPSTLRVPSGSKIIVPEGKTLTVPKDSTLEVEEGGEVENNGTINNKGSITNNGTLTNNGTITNEDDAKINNKGDLNNKEGGTIDNSGKIDNSGNIDNKGDLNNKEGGTIDNSGKIDNSGNIDNKGDINNKEGGEIDNTGKIDNSGNIDNKGDINNKEGGEIDNSGKIDNSGNINNKGDLNNKEGGEIDNTGKIDNSGNIDNKGDLNNKEGGEIDNTGKIDNTGNIDNKGDINNKEGGTIDNKGNIDNTGNIDNKGDINNEDGGSIHNSGEGTIDNTGTIEGGGEISYDGDSKLKVVVTYDPCGGTVTPASEEKIYKDKDGVKQYGTLPTPTRAGYKFEGWYTEKIGGTQVKEDTLVMENIHTLFAHWESKPEVIIPTQPDNGSIELLTPNPLPGDTVIFMVTPNEGYQVKGLPTVQILRQEDSVKLLAAKSGNEIGIDVESLGDNKYSFIMPDAKVTISAEFEKIPEPTPDPSVNPDGGGASSKTGDPFMGGVALALLGVATTGAVLVRKRN